MVSRNSPEMTALLQKVCFRGFTLRKVYWSVQCTTITAAAVTKGTAPGLGQGFHSGLAVTTGGDGPSGSDFLGKKPT